jgi:hypothetical protein
MGLQGLKDVTRNTARDLSGLAGELAALKADAQHWLIGPEYAALKHRLKPKYPTTASPATARAGRRAPTGARRKRRASRGLGTKLAIRMEANGRAFYLLPREDFVSLAVAFRIMYKGTKVLIGFITMSLVFVVLSLLVLMT